VAATRSEAELDFADKSFENFAKTGITAGLTVQAPLVAYSVRAAAQDEVEGKARGGKTRARSQRAEGAIAAAQTLPHDPASEASQQCVRKASCKPNFTAKRLLAKPFDSVSYL
jgi:hypothetical protein